MSKKPIVKMINISKRFGGIQALYKVNLELYPGEVLGLVGDNGAGKSTLMKILAGVYRADEGEIYLEGKKVEIDSPLTARRLGIEMIYQDLENALAPNLDVIENMFLGREYTKFLGVIDRKRMEQMARKVLEELGIKIPSLKVKVRYLSGGQQQAVAIARTLLFKPKVLLMDEPTTALSVERKRHVLELVKRIKQRGDIGIIFVSHIIPDVLEVADRVMVLRTGIKVAEKDASELTIDDVIKLMMGGT